MKNTRMSREYLASPIFLSDVDCMGHVDIADMAISRGLARDISSWDHEYQSTFNDEYPPDSGFDSLGESNRHSNEGRCLAERLQQELGSEYVVEYCV